MFPKTAPAQLGRLHWADGKVTLIDPSGAHKDLSFDEKKPDVIKAGSVSFFIIKRGDRMGVRAKDSESPVRKNFEGMSYFPINPAMRFEATLIPDVQKIPILNVLGQTEMKRVQAGWSFIIKATLIAYAQSTKIQPTAKPFTSSSKT